MSLTPVWFITGASGGFGLEIAKLVLQQGYRAVLTARDPSRFADIVEQHPDNAIALKLDVTSKPAIAAAVKEALQRFGRIDVLVNNAGYGYLAAIEEGEDDDIRRQFDTNLFGLIDVTKQVLPGMRARRSGTVVNMSSLGGLMAFAATGYYHATKFAVEAVCESLAQEVAPLGIKVIIVEPGAFRTNWAGSSMKESPVAIADYAETAGKRRESTKAGSGKQPGDPARAALAILKAVEADEPPLRLLLGKPALDLAYKRLESLKNNFDRWRETTLSADFHEAKR